MPTKAVGSSSGESESKSRNIVSGLAICDDVESAVPELDKGELNLHKIVPKRIACTNCGFAVSEQHALVSQVLLESQVTNLRGETLQEFELK